MWPQPDPSPDARFELEMHIGKENALSKTEYVIFSPSHFFNSLLPPAIENCNNGSDSDNTFTYIADTLTDADQHNEQKTRK
jgi:hypothetical protein